MYQITIIFLAVSFGLISACKCTDASDSSLGKLDAKSIAELKKAESEGSSKNLPIVILLNEEPNEETINKISEAGVKIIVTTGNIISANAKADAIRKISNFDSIKSIEVNKSKIIN